MRSVRRFIAHLAYGCVLLGAVVVTTIPATFAQAGTVCGTVQDQSGAVMVGAELELKASGNRLVAKTGANGEFCFNGIEPGEYELSAQALDSTEFCDDPAYTGNLLA